MKASDQNLEAGLIGEKHLHDNHDTTSTPPTTQRSRPDCSLVRRLGLVIVLLTILFFTLNSILFGSMVCGRQSLQHNTNAQLHRPVDEHLHKRQEANESEDSANPAETSNVSVVSEFVTTVVTTTVTSQVVSSPPSSDVVTSESTTEQSSSSSSPDAITTTSVSSVSTTEVIPPITSSTTSSEVQSDVETSSSSSVVTSAIITSTTTTTIAIETSTESRPVSSDSSDEDSSSRRSTITTGSATTSSAVRQTYTTTQNDGDVVIITTTSWVEIVPAQATDEPEDPDLQNLATRSSIGAGMTSAIALTMAFMLLA